MKNNKPTVRTVKTKDDHNFTLYFIDEPQKLIWYNQQEHHKTNCFFCNKLTSSSDAKDLGNYIIDTELSLFENHKLLISKSHGGEYIIGHLRFLLDYIQKNNHQVISYDGNKNTKTKDFHFYCHILDSHTNLPLIKDYKNAQLISTQKEVSISVMENYGRGTIILSSKEAENIANAFYELEKLIGVSFSNNTHPYVNLFIGMVDDTYVIAVIPRVVFKPSEYYDATNDWNTAINSLEMGGLFLLHHRDEFLHVTPEFLTKLCSEVSFNNEHIKEIVNSLQI